MEVARPDNLALVVGVVAALVSYLWFYRWKQRNHVGPKTWPILGSYLEMKANWDRLHDWITDYMKMHPTATLAVKVMGSNLYFTANPKNVEYMLKTNWTNYIKGPVLYETATIMLGDGIFIVDGEKWKVVRKLASFEFSSGKLRDFSTEIYRTDGVRLATILDGAAKCGNQVDLQDLLLRMTMDSFCKIGFGVDQHSLRADLPQVRFVDAFQRMGKLLQGRQIGPIWKLKRALNIGEEREMSQLRKHLDDFLYKIIKDRKVEMESLQVKGQLNANDLLSRFMLFKDDEGRSLSDEWLRDVAINFILAGRDTTAGTLAWVVYSTCRRADVIKMCREELDRVLGHPADDSISSFADLLTYESVKDLHYLHSTITETLRLYPAVSNDPKYAVHDDIMPDGTPIKGNSTVNYHPFAMGRLQTIWGPDAEEFKPERWMKDGVFQPESPFKFTAFQAGPRICLGIGTAYLQMKVVAAILMQFFNFQLVPTSEVAYNVSLILTLTMKHGLHVTVSRR
ncbi:hypothetical protein Mapa_007455 [Marchantia paleacea]|nr:hypothetical protein Mapa_007455 [Marchantia paleacea]